MMNAILPARCMSHIRSSTARARSIARYMPSTSSSDRPSSCVTRRGVGLGHSHSAPRLDVDRRRRRLPGPPRRAPRSGSGGRGRSWRSLPTVPSTSRASVGSASRSPACGPMMCAPSRRPVSASATNLAKPSISPTIVALPSARNGNEPTLTSRPAAFASSSVKPDRCDLRAAERDARHEVHSDRLRVVAGKVLDRDDRLVAGDVREGEAGHDVADGVQVLDAGAHELVDHRRSRDRA